ncbi:MAG: flippase-like domain-containing protein [Candidatus Dormibacteraeota bacterium]|uniref:Flippase-like domain-containing protein n=1 Tax=Candidatus Amunia macphersoniae TaxID=3127014 RepID=A0A934KRP2_9BACT|nr:flippase-like domain-containing protein [Candidatus Dormibacteraeota bacterium]
MAILRALFASTWLRIGGTVAGVAFLVHNVDMGKAGSSLVHADWRWASLALALTTIACLASVFEWGVLLRTSAGLGVGNQMAHAEHQQHHHLFGWTRLSSSYLQSLFFSQLLPAGIGGDAMRTVEMGKVVGHGKILASLAGSRMAGTLGMACWGLAAAVLLRGWVGIGSLIGACVFAAVMMLAWVAALAADRILGRHVVARSSRAFVRTLHSFGQTFSGYRRHPHAIVQCIVVGAAGWGVNILALEVFAKAIGADISWTVFAVAIPVTLVATLTPFSINGLGIREGVLVGMLAHAGVSSGHAAAMSVLVDVQMLPFGILGAGLWMRHRRRAAAPSIDEVAVAEMVAAKELLTSV